MWVWAARALFASGATALVIIAAGLRVAKALSESVGRGVAPSEAQLREEHHERHALFRWLPALARKLAWRELGDNFPTPIHRGSVAGVQFWVKREDLASTKLYGGNKVRTLQHQLAVIEARAERGDVAAHSKLVAIGSGGSNQVLATVVMSEHLRERQRQDAQTPITMPRTTAVFASKDKADLDNTINLLSSLSFLTVPASTWGTPLSAFSSLLGPALSGSGIVIPPGGNNPLGVMGQISGALELAEQIASGIMPDPDCIYLPVGSSCTISGLILGVCLARRQRQHLRQPVFAKHEFQICGVLIHHALAAGQRAAGMEMATWAKHIPFMLRHTLHVASAELARLGGPDLLQDALAMIENGGVRLESSEEIVGKYGSHSELSLEASRLYDEESTILDPKTGARAKELWLCGHFAGKAFAELLRAERMRDQKDRTVLFWQTKSAIQPRLEGIDEWEIFKQDMPDKVKRWAEKGQAHSKLRVGAVNVDAVDVDKAGYRGLMHAVNFSKL